jgi:hypothetical protein
MSRRAARLEDGDELHVLGALRGSRPLLALAGLPGV